MSRPLPRHACAVIVGGGVVGCSLAYHLGRAGWRDVLLLEQGRLTGGTTWHAAGLVGQLRASRNHTELAVYSTRLYAELEMETSQATGWRRCGSVQIATTPERVTALRRAADLAPNFDIDCELLDGAEAARRWPLMRHGDVRAALWLPGDGKVNPADLTQALARGARAAGVAIREGVRVTGVRRRNDAVAGVETDAGPVAADIVVNCAGQWARQLGALAGVDVPLHAAEHFYMVTGPIDGVTPDLPVLRDPDGYVYFKEEVGGLVMGGFEPQAKPWASERVPEDFQFHLLPDDWDHFAVLVDNGLHRVPALQTAEVKQSVNGLESFTPDGHFIAGEAPGLRGFYVLAGFNSAGIASAGGAGRVMAQWLEAGEAPMDVFDVDIRRFASFHNSPGFLRERTVETLGLHYAVRWPRMELRSGRPVRRSPLYDRLAARGACLGSKMGWERANWFARDGAEPRHEHTFDRPGWLPACLAEQRAAREAVAVIDQTSLSKFLIQGPGAEALLQRLCANDVAVAPGRVVYSGMLNARGGYESDVAVTRLEAERFLLTGGSAQATRDHDRLLRHLEPGGRVAVTDVISAYAVLALAGPRSVELLQRLCREELDPESFPPGRARRLFLASAPVLALRLSYAGGLGFELYVATEFAAGLYDALHEEGAGLGLADAGHYALDALRIEAGNRAWGAELTPEETPVEAGLTGTTKADKAIAFLGRKAVAERMRRGTARRLVQLRVDGPGVMLWGGEPMLRDGRRVGELTSAGVAAASGCIVAMGYTEAPRALASPGEWRHYVEGGRFEVLCAGRLVPATASLGPALGATGR